MGSMLFDFCPQSTYVLSYETHICMVPGLPDFLVRHTKIIYQMTTKRTKQQ
jgi:hypothetical protein